MSLHRRPASPLQRRLRPLHVVAFLQGLGFWVPVEKLFLNEIGFDIATVGLMAAAYAAVVPLIEIPSGVLADRWSRRGVLAVAGGALALSALLGGISHSVVGYLPSALALGVYFALYSGTMDALIYDTVLEETGRSDAYERQLGRNRLINSAALVLSALAGGALAGLAGTRLTYLVTVPCAALSVFVLWRYVEPRLHHTAERSSLKEHLALTFRTLTRRGRLLPIITLSVLVAVALQVVLEFGPLWLVALAAPAVLYGPYWAGVVSSLGLGGLLAGRLRLDRPATAGAVAALLVGCGVVLCVGAPLVVVIMAQVLLALLVVAASIHVSRQLHDAVPSEVRAGVASGVGTFGWAAFLPLSVLVGLLGEARGMAAAGWALTAVTAMAGALLVLTAVSGRRAATEADRAGRETPVPVP